MSAYLCSDDTLNALSTFYYLKSGKTDEERKSHVMRAIRITNRDSFYERQQIAETFEDRMKLRAKFDKFCDGLYDIWLDQYSEGNFYKMIFNILLRENQNSLMARYNDKDYAERLSYNYVHSNCVNYWDDHNQLGYLVGIINNYDYQSCEHDNYKDSLGYAILDQIKEFLLRELQLGEIWDFDEKKFIEENKLFQPIS
jgi:hypothetical protein|tara:strand:- start:12 stop:605 length:594 start_codon:yes stop_codon:yes gene_type:complete